MKQTAVEWVVKQLLNAEPNVLEWQKYLIEGKAMEKEQHGHTWDIALLQKDLRGGNVMRAWEDFDEYYQEHYGK